MTLREGLYSLSFWLCYTCDRQSNFGDKGEGITLEQAVAYIRQLLESPTIGYLGTRDARHQVFSTIVFSFAVQEDPPRLVAHIPEPAIVEARRNLLICDYVAVLFGDAQTYENIQIKGRAAVRAATESEEAYSVVMHRRLNRFYGSGLLDDLRMTPLMAVEVEINEMYNQAPGSGAGEPLVFDRREGGSAG